MISKCGDYDYDDVEQLFDDMLENDLAFRNMVEAMDHTANNTDLEPFEFALVASAALASSDRLSQKEWLDSLIWDQPVQIAIRSENIGAAQLPGRIKEAIERINYYGLWPWT